MPDPQHTTIDFLNNKCDHLPEPAAFPKEWEHRHTVDDETIELVHDYKQAGPPHAHCWRFNGSVVVDVDWAKRVSDKETEHVIELQRQLVRWHVPHTAVTAISGTVVSFVAYRAGRLAKAKVAELCQKLLDRLNAQNYEIQLKTLQEIAGDESEREAIEGLLVGLTAQGRATKRYEGWLSTPGPV